MMQAPLELKVVSQSRRFLLCSNAATFELACAVVRSHDRPPRFTSTTGPRATAFTRYRQRRRCAVFAAMAGLAYSNTGCHSPSKGMAAMAAARGRRCFDTAGRLRKAMCISYIAQYAMPLHNSPPLRTDAPTCDLALWNSPEMSEEGTDGL